MVPFPLPTEYSFLLIVSGDGEQNDGNPGSDGRAGSVVLLSGLCEFVLLKREKDKKPLGACIMSKA